MSVRLSNSPSRKKTEVSGARARPYRSLLTASFRYLEDVMRELKNVAEELNALEQISRRQRIQLAHVVMAADFKISIRKDAYGPILKGSPKLTDMGLKVEDVNRMTQNLNVVQEAYSKFNDLLSMENELEQKFQGMDTTTAVMEIRRLRMKAQVILDENLTFIQSIAKAHEPSGFSQFCKLVTKMLANGIQYKEGNEYRYVYEKDGFVTFSRYFHLMKVKDDDGHFFPNKIVVASFVLTGRPHASYNLTVMDEFEPPGKFPLGKEVASIKDAQRTLALLLEADRFSTSLSRIPVEDILQAPLTKNVFSFSALIKSLSVKPDEIVFQLKPEVSDEDTISKIANQLHLEFTGLVARRSVKVYVRPDVSKRKLRVIFTTSSGEPAVTEDDLEFLKSRFGLTTETIHRIATIVNLRAGT